jgi:hypothetical protein
VYAAEGHPHGCQSVAWFILKDEAGRQSDDKA